MPKWETNKNFLYKNFSNQGYKKRTKKNFLEVKIREKFGLSEDQIITEKIIQHAIDVFFGNQFNNDNKIEVFGFK